MSEATTAFDAMESFLKFNVVTLAEAVGREHDMIRIQVSGTEEDDNQELEAVFAADSTHPMIESGEDDGEQYGYFHNSDDPKIIALQVLFETYNLYCLFPNDTVWEAK